MATQKSSAKGSPQDRLNQAEEARSAQEEVIHLSDRITIMPTHDIVWPYVWFDSQTKRSYRTCLPVEDISAEMIEECFDELEAQENRLKPDWWNWW